MANKENIELQIEVLGSLISASGDLSNGGWIKPRQIGAWDASYHSRVLKTLCRKNCVERKEMPSLARTRSQHVYRPTAAGVIFYDMATANSAKESK
jgi:hypothetical protein